MCRSWLESPNLGASALPWINRHSPRGASHRAMPRLANSAAERTGRAVDQQADGIASVGQAG